MPRNPTRKIRELSQIERDELTLILGKGSVQTLLHTIRARLGVTPGSVRKMCRELRRHEQLKKLGQRNSYDKLNWSYLRFRMKITLEDLTRLREVSGLTQASIWLKNLILLGPDGALLRPRPGVHLLQKGEGQRLYIQIFRASTLGDVERAWPDVRQLQKGLPSIPGSRLRSSVAVIRNEEAHELYMEVFKTSRLEDAENAWLQLRKLKMNLPGVGSFRVKKNLGRDKIIALKHEKGRRMKQVYADIPALFPDNSDVQPGAFRQARQRLKKRLV